MTPEEIGVIRAKQLLRKQAVCFGEWGDKSSQHCSPDCGLRSACYDVFYDKGNDYPYEFKRNI